ncbi:hypothetical protein BASA81_001716 [Batrachochytrium salamandrivorans]|nr:hypothetical protein BASA81_001716 [Batrachochytrium salamandrivorans]
MTSPHLQIRFNLAKRSTANNQQPVVEFVEDVDAYLKHEQLEDKVDSVLEEFNRLHRGFKLDQQRLAAEKADLEKRLPDLEQNLKLVEELQRAESDVSMRFMAADSVWTDAVVKHRSGGPEIGLWLGANVLVEYTCDEAVHLLAKSVNNSKQLLATKTQELNFTKSQLTTCEVSISRFYNYDVQRRKKLREQQGLN